MIITRDKYRKYLRNCMIREISIKDIMKECIVRPANPSGRSRSLQTVSARTAAEK